MDWQRITFYKVRFNELFSYLSHLSFHQRDHSRDEPYDIDTFTFHVIDTGEPFTLNLYRNIRDSFDFYIVIRHPTIGICDRTHHILKQFDYLISAFELTNDFMNTNDTDLQYLFYEWLQHKLFMKYCGTSPSTIYKYNTRWNDTKQCTKALYLYIKDIDADINIQNSCRFETIFRNGFKSFGIRTELDLINSSHEVLVKMLGHIHLKVIDWKAFKRLFDNAKMNRTWKSVKWDISRKLSDSQLNETFLYVKDKYKLKLPLIDDEDSSFFRALLSQGRLSDFLSRHNNHIGNVSN
jgi:hypothetical protein